MSEMDHSQNDNAGHLRGPQRWKRRAAVVIAVVALGTAAVACSSTNAEQREGEDPQTTGPSSVAPSDPSPMQTVRDIMELPNFAPLEPGTYFIDPDSDASTPLRVVYGVPVQGWSQWFGAVK